MFQHTQHQQTMVNGFYSLQAEISMGEWQRGWTPTPDLKLLRDTETDEVGHGHWSGRFCFVFQFFFKRQWRHRSSAEQWVPGLLIRYFKFFFFFLLFQHYFLKDMWDWQQNRCNITWWILIFTKWHLKTWINMQPEAWNYAIFRSK